MNCDLCGKFSELLLEIARPNGAYLGRFCFTDKCYVKKLQEWLHNTNDDGVLMRLVELKN